MPISYVSKLLKGLKVTQSTERGKTIDEVLSYYVINLRVSNVNTVSTKLQCAALVHYFLLHQACNLALQLHACFGGVSSLTHHPTFKDCENYSAIYSSITHTHHRIYIS